MRHRLQQVDDRAGEVLLEYPAVVRTEQVPNGDIEGFGAPGEHQDREHDERDTARRRRCETVGQRTSRGPLLAPGVPES